MKGEMVNFQVAVVFKVKTIVRDAYIPLVK